MINNDDGLVNDFCCAAEKIYMNEDTNIWVLILCECILWQLCYNAHCLMGVNRTIQLANDAWGPFYSMVKLSMDK